ncbi:hypothetical protein ACEWY4_024398 [Coilia grayii]|uniref:RRM domain-containing protein n=1 Tax=Coilia grayii TaxID=363190 RepID=A0ABD1J289_9TELE
MTLIRVTTLGSKHTGCEASGTRHKTPFLQQQEQDPTNLYISNLPVSMDEQELENMLKPFGHVISTRILRDANGVSRGVGFARMESTEKCEVVIQHFNGKYLKTPPGIPVASIAVSCVLQMRDACCRQPSSSCQIARQAGQILVLPFNHRPRPQHHPTSTSPPHTDHYPLFDPLEFQMTPAPTLKQPILLLRTFSPALRNGLDIQRPSQWSAI